MTLFDDSYNEIQSISTGLYKERGSKFIAYLYPVYTKKEIEEKLRIVKKKEKSASHYCYAYTLRPDRSLVKTHDDGEPVSTAGKPILTQIKINQLTNIIVVVVRYFGGKKLGIPGLIRAYKNATINGMKNATIINKKIKEQYEISFNHTEMNDVMKVIKKHNLEIQKSCFQENNLLVVNVLKTKSDVFLKIFKKNSKVKVNYKTMI